MAAADVVITGTVLTVDESRPTAEALAVADGRIVAVGDRSEVGELIGSDTQTIDLGDGCVMPGFVEAHGHPLMEAIALSDRLVDIRPVTLRDADDVVGAVRREVARRGSDGAYLNGWDPLLQPGLPEPRQAWLDEMAPDGPLVGSLEVGKYADMVVLSADPRTVPPECIADLEVRATFLAGRQVYAQ
jgi:predicted amidohydrolase YtcJ